jgi:glycosyltransferase involved in cell wall biosynthesis
MIEYDVVIPTIGRSSLDALLSALRKQQHQPAHVYVVHDDHGQGPATMRNHGWRASSAAWIVFLDDDVVPTKHWSAALIKDLDTDSSVGAVQGSIRVPDQPARPTDSDLATIRLESASCVTADLAVRRSALESVDGFDERLPRAYREDTDLALRLTAQGWSIERGTRVTLHPLRRDARWWSSVVRQRGNADDAFMRRRHGADWRSRADVPRGAFPLHVAATAGLALAASGVLARRRALTVAGAAIWTTATMTFLLKRLAATSHEPVEVLATVGTSVAIPPVAVGARVAGEWRHRRVEAA